MVSLLRWQKSQAIVSKLLLPSHISTHLLGGARHPECHDFINSLLKVSSSLDMSLIGHFLYVSTRFWSVQI